MTPVGDQFDALMEWRNEEDVDFWRAGAVGTLSRVMVPPKLQSYFEDFLKSNKIAHEVYLEDCADVEKVFEADRVQRLRRKKTRSVLQPSAVPNFTFYWDNEEISAYCNRLAATYPQLVQKEFLASTFEGRDVFAMKISSGTFGQKPIIFMDGGMHSREWVSQASIMYLLHRMVEDRTTSNEMLENVDWIIIPNLNPGW